MLINTVQLNLSERMLLWRVLRKILRYAGIDYEIEIEIENGLRMRLDPKQRLTGLIWSTDFEWAERQFLKDYLRTGDVFVDIGANVGLFSLLAGRMVGPSGSVYAFEPCFTAYDRLLRNVDLNKLSNVSCHQLAISDSAGTCIMNTSLDGYDAWNSFAIPQGGTTFGKESVECSTWDEFACRTNLVGRVTIMKMDVEGWETRVLSGASQSLGRDDAPILLVEFTEANCRSAGVSCAQLYQALQDLGYKMYTYDLKSRTLVFDPLRDDYPYMNLICIKHLDEIKLR